MSQAPYIKNELIRNKFNIFEAYADLERYFEKQKNPKIFMFFLSLVALASQEKQAKIFFNILKMSYRYDVCEKTIKLWLKELERLELIKFQFKNKQLYFIEVLDYKQSKIYKLLTTQENKKETELPTRFYKNVAQIIKRISKNFADKEFKLENEVWRIINPSMKRSYVAIEFQNKEDCRFHTIRTYEFLTKKFLPPINNPYHLRIIKSNLKKSLELLSS